MKKKIKVIDILVNQLNYSCINDRMCWCCDLCVKDNFCLRQILNSYKDKPSLILKELYKVIMEVDND